MFDKDVMSLVLFAAWMGQHDILKTLLQLGADVNIPDKTGRTPLSYAAPSGYLEMVNILTESGSESINSQDKYGRTALDHALTMGKNKSC